MASFDKPLAASALGRAAWTLSGACPRVPSNHVNRTDHRTCLHLALASGPPRLRRRSGRRVAASILRKCDRGPPFEIRGVRQPTMWPHARGTPVARRFTFRAAESSGETGLGEPDWRRRVCWRARSRVGRSPTAVESPHPGQPAGQRFSVKALPQPAIPVEARPMRVLAATLGRRHERWQQQGGRRDHTHQRQHHQLGTARSVHSYAAHGTPIRQLGRRPALQPAAYCAATLGGRGRCSTQATRAT